MDTSKLSWQWEGINVTENIAVKYKIDFNTISGSTYYTGKITLGLFISFLWG